MPPNASRTLLFNIHTGEWDDDLLKIPACAAFRCSGGEGLFPPISATSVPDILGGSIMISGIAGDQQAATIGQACFEPGMMEIHLRAPAVSRCSTPAPRQSNQRTSCSPRSPIQLGGKRTYALEGSIFVAGSAVQWLRDGSRHHQAGRRNRTSGGQVRFDAERVSGAGLRRPGRALLESPRCAARWFGLTRNTGPAELAHAVLESVCYPDL